MAAESTLQIHDVVDSRPFGPLQVRVAALCSLVVFMDGFDTQAIGYVAPAIVEAWDVERGVLGPVFSAGLFGLMLGALALGPLADRVGRRPVLLGCTLWFGVLSLATAAADSIASLLVLRFLTGLGLGGAMPNAIALTSEYTPHRLRATVVMVMFCGFSLGAALGGVAAASLIDRFGWTAVFVLGGAAPGLAFVPLLFFLPESMRYQARRADRRAAAAAMLAKVAPDLRIDAARLAPEQHADERFPVRELFAGGRTRVTLLLWVVFFMSLLDLYFVSNWLPTVITSGGIPLERAVLITATFQVGGTVGTIGLGRLFDRFPPFRMLALTYFGASVFVLLIGVAGTSVAWLYATVFGAGLCIVGGQIGANALTANVYPTHVRATGIGWALGIGRIGSIVGPALGGWLLAMQWQTTPLFMVAAIPVLVAAAAAFLISKR